MLCLYEALLVKSKSIGDVCVFILRIIMFQTTERETYSTAQPQMNTKTWFYIEYFNIHLYILYHICAFRHNKVQLCFITNQERLSLLRFNPYSQFRFDCFCITYFIDKYLCRCTIKSTGMDTRQRMVFSLQYSICACVYCIKTPVSGNWKLLIS